MLSLLALQIAAYSGGFMVAIQGIIRNVFNDIHDFVSMGIVHIHGVLIPLGILTHFLTRGQVVN